MSRRHDRPHLLLSKGLRRGCRAQEAARVVEIDDISSPVHLLTNGAAALVCARTHRLWHDHALDVGGIASDTAISGGGDGAAHGKNSRPRELSRADGITDGIDRQLMGPAPRAHVQYGCEARPHR